MIERISSGAIVLAAALAIAGPASAQGQDDTYGPPVNPPAKPATPAAPAKPGAPTGEDLEPKSVVREVVVRGNQRVGDDRILLSVPITAGDRVGRSDVVDAIQRIYGMGYFQDVKASTEPIFGGERLIFTVVENPVFGDVVFEGVTKVDPAKLEALFQTLKGDVLNYVAIKEAVEQIQKLYQEAGYPLARVSGMDVRPGGILALRIAEGRIHSIKVSGNEETKDYVVLREMTSEPGEVFSAEKIRNDLRRVYNLNYFEEINLKFEPAPGDDPEQIVVVIDVKEKQTGSINLGAGYSTREGILGMFSIKKDNLFGTGQQVGLDLSVSQQYRVAGELTYFNPWFDQARTGLGGSIFARRFNNFLANFREERYGLSINGSRPLFGDPLASPWRATLGVRGESIYTFENLWVGGAPKARYGAGEPLAGQSITISPTGMDSIVGASAGITYDTRDILMSPTEGWFNQLTLEPGLVNPGSADYRTPLLRANGTVSHFIPLPSVPWAPTERTTIAISTRLGLISGMGGQVPAYERFFSTGQYLVRGWPEFFTLDALQSTNLPLNYFQGANVAVGTVEYRFPVFNIVSGAVFADSGMFWDNSIFDGQGNMLLHSGYGLGLRVNTPLGPIRLDYGLRGQDIPGRGKGEFHFGIGQKF